MADDPIRVDSLEPYPPAMHAHFAEVTDGDKTLYEYRPPDKSKDVERLNGALRKERERAGQLAKQLEERASRVVLDDEHPTTLVLGDQELESGDLRKLLDAAREQQSRANPNRAEQEQELARVRTRLESAHKKALADKDSEWQTKYKEISDALEDVLIVQGLQAAAMSPDLPFKFRPEAVEDLVAYVRMNKLAKVDGRNAVPLTAAGDVLDNGKGETGTLVDLIQTIVARKPHWVEASSGTGAQSSSASTNGASRKKLADMSEAEKIAYVNKHGLEKFRELVESQGATSH